MPQKTLPHIAILGGGFGGVMAARELGKKLEGRAHITLIDRNMAHVFAPLLYEVATAFTVHENLGTATLLKSGVVIEYPTMLARWGVDFLEDEIEGIDWKERNILTKKEGKVPFDYVIIALGAETNFYGIEGLEKNAFTLKTIRDADRLRQKVHDFLHKTEMGKEEYFDIVIGGGGATGVELAAELTLFLRQHLIKGHLKPSQFRISLVEAQSRVLPVMDETFSLWAKERLEKYGVKLYLDTCIKRHETGSAIIAPRPLREGETTEQLVCDFRAEKERTIEADMLVWTGGVQGASVLKNLDVPLDGRGGRIKVTDDLTIPDRAFAFAIGDSVELTDPSTGHPVPWLAQAAILQGTAAAKNLIRVFEGGQPIACKIHDFPIIVTLGGKFGVAKVGKFKFRGFGVWLLRGAADLRYFLGILPPFEAVRFWWQGIKIYSKND